MTKEQKQLIAQTIINQIGGMGRLKAMIGAKDFLIIESGVRFKFAKAYNGINYISIVLNGNDLYDVEYKKVGSKNAITIATSNDLYSDMLKSDFEQTTKLYLSL